MIHREIRPAARGPFRGPFHRRSIAQIVGQGCDLRGLQHLEHQRPGLQGRHRPCLVRVVDGVVMHLAQHDHIHPAERVERVGPDLAPIGRQRDQQQGNQKPAHQFNSA